MPRVEFDMDTPVPPERIVAALTDFSERRPEIWPGLWKGAYEVYEVGDTWAVVREGNEKPRIWARERYDWSTPGTVRWEVIESNFCTPGSFVEVKVSPGRDGGSRLHVTWNRTATSFKWRLGLATIALTRGAPVKASIKKALDRMTERQAS